MFEISTELLDILIDTIHIKPDVRNYILKGTLNTTQVNT